HLLTAPAVAQGDRDRPLGGLLANDETVQFGDDLLWCHGRHGADPGEGGRDAASEREIKTVFKAPSASTFAACCAGAQGITAFRSCGSCWCRCTTRQQCQETFAQHLQR